MSDSVHAHALGSALQARAGLRERREVEFDREQTVRPTLEFAISKRVTRALRDNCSRAAPHSCSVRWGAEWNEGASSC